MKSLAYTENIILHPLFSMRHSIALKNLRVWERRTHSFLYILQGELTYTAQKRLFTARQGDLVYLPKGSCYSYAVGAGEGDFLQVEFTALSELSETTWGNAPILLKGNERIEEIFRELIEQQNQNTPEGYLRAVGMLYCLFAVLVETLDGDHLDNRRLAPAIRYMERHLSDRVRVERLAQLCYMSPSQLRRLFLREYGLSPIAYRNRLRMEKAKDMLCYGSLRVSEIAALLGYDNVYAFSAAFKRETGVSPTEFASTH